jgi:hypothetical protein
MNDEENINEFSEPPKIIKTKDVRVVIMELPAITDKIIHTFLFAYPYKFDDGGFIRVYNYSFHVPLIGQEVFATKFLLWKAFVKIQLKALADNSDLKIIYRGPILNEDGYRKAETNES